MRTTPSIRFLFLCSTVLWAVVMAACGGQGPATAPTNPPASEMAPIPEPLAEAVPEPPSESSGEAQGIDLATVDVCQLLPVAEIEAVVGKLREGSPKETISIDREKGCEYIEDVNGHFYEITVYPLDHWGLVKYTLNEATPLDGVGDGAYTGAYSDAAALEVLVKDCAVIGVRVSDEKQQTALALYELARKHLPQLDRR